MSKTKQAPSIVHAADYSAATFYLDAVRAAGTNDGDKLMPKMNSTKVSDYFVKHVEVREDDSMVHTIFLTQVRPPAEV